jgi:hypothetical protein
MTAVLILIGLILGLRIAVMVCRDVLVDDCSLAIEMEEDSDYFLNQQSGVDKRGVGGR